MIEERILAGGKFEKINFYKMIKIDNGEIALFIWLTFNCIAAKYWNQIRAHKKDVE